MNIKLVTLSSLIKFKELLMDIINTKVSELNTAISAELATKSDIGHRHDNATTSKDGFMSASDKVKLNGITAGSAAGNVPILAATLSSLYTNCLLVSDSSGKVASYDKTPTQIAYWGNGGGVCTTDAVIRAKTVSISGFTLYTGVTVKVMFKNGNSNNAPTLNVNSTGEKNIKVVKAGIKITPPVHTGKWRGVINHETTEAWQPLTTLELMYDGTDWVIIGNPVVENYYSKAGGYCYTVYADGLIIQWGRVAYPRTDSNVVFPIQYTSNLSYSILLSGAAAGHPAYYYAYEIDYMTINIANDEAEICWMTIGY